MHPENNKRKAQKTIQIKGKMPVATHFCRDAEAAALNVNRAQLDRATLLTCAMEQLRGNGNREDAADKESSP